MELIFSKSLTRTDVAIGLAVPTEALGIFNLKSLHNSHHEDLLVADEKGIVWTFGLSIRSHGHPKPKIRKGWINFVRSKGLKVGDKVLFYRSEDDPLKSQYKISVEKAIKLKGKQSDPPSDGEQVDAMEKQKMGGVVKSKPVVESHDGAYEQKFDGPMDDDDDGSIKKKKSSGVDGGVVCCQVDSCSLTEAKAYYRRHKVCGFHSKAPVVILDGLQQRFCHQCSRFHELSEFDEVKRSCRRHLAGHFVQRRSRACVVLGKSTSHKVTAMLKSQKRSEHLCESKIYEQHDTGSSKRSFSHKEKIVAEDESNQEPEDRLPFSVERDTNASSEQGGAVLEEMPEGEEWHAKAIFLTDCKPVLPESPNCPSMGLLSLEGCKALRIIPTSFFNQMPVLKYLNLSHTSIRSLPESLFKLDSLESLVLRCCKLFMELSPQIGQLHNLLELDLDETQIVGLPKEIGKLSNLEILKLSLDECMNCGKQLWQNVLIHPGTIGSLFKLTELKIDVNPDSEGWNAVEEVVVEEACSLKSLKSLTLYLPHVQILGKRKTGSTSLSFYPLSSFRFTVGQHRQRIFSRVPERVEAHFEKWAKCLKFVRGTDISSEMKRVVGYTKAFYLKCHASARSLCDFGIENMENLEFCLLAECNKIQTIIDGGKPHEKEQTDMVEGEATNCESYSAQEPALLNLQFLHIYYLEHLESIWSSPTYDKPCLSALKFLELHSCPKLEVILSPTLLTNLGKLEVLIVKDCPELISVVSRESNASFKFASDCFLPSLKMMLLLFLPKLESISREFHIASKLKMIGFYDCSELRYLCKKELSSENLEVIKGEREWWKALKLEESEWGNHLDYLHTIFSPIDEDDHVMTQMEKIYKFIEGIPYPGLGPTP